MKDKSWRFDPDDVIGRRELQLMNADGSESEVIVEIGRPRRFEDADEGQEDCYAPYRISGGGICVELYAGGVDAVQALQLVMRIVGSDLEALGSSHEDRLTWLQEPAHLGFPACKSTDESR
jgi:hypothetical protein